MKIRRTAAVATITAVPLALGALGAGTAHAHGTSQNPPSRIQLCSTQGGENPENFSLPACKAAKAAVGNNPAPFYDPNAVNIAAAAGKHRQLIPDGKLCSAGNPQYAGLDLPRTDWPTTNLPSGGAFTFLYKGTAPHKGTFEYYITKDGFDVTKPLKWSDLEDKPFLTATDPGMEAGAYVMKGQLPKKSGRHLVYVVWQRSDSPEAFYSCSDVAFDGSGKPAPQVPAPGKPGGSGGTGTGTSGGTGTTGSAGSKPGGTSGTGGSSGAADHSGHGTPTPGGAAKPAGTVGSTTGSATGTPSAAAAGTGGADGTAPVANAADELAQTGAEPSTSVGLLAGTAAGVLTLGAGSLIYARRRAAR
ncbi:lytic polysaccharide monooxygenase auxiliary activity family 9 protein [Yinghuangia soli]|uniref:Lytic polysaccharide monooxygenase n=1 Tax=Yinghuangia soli TaxID=2908204 RepID=A0AA41Q1H5_9ACTN|nr:lytic polysaccharide monooxygenase [Yinghuangia soli]MCF2529462.1 lytic polysaccharide monooxygenase [Yinghuangia soli]